MGTLNPLVLLLAVGLALFALIQLRAALGVYRGASGRRPRSISDQRRQPPQALAPLLGALTLLGFRRFGEVEIVTPDMGVLGSMVGRNTSHTVWLLLDGPQTTLAEVVEGGPMVSLETWLSDQSIIQTTYPLGEDIDVPGLRATAVDSSPADAYEHHRRMVDARSGSAPPVGAHSMGDYLRRDASYRERFATVFLRRAMLRGPLLTTALTLLLAGGLVGVALLGGAQ